jgi:hypothetical protein
LEIECPPGRRPAVPCQIQFAARVRGFVAGRAKITRAHQRLSISWCQQRFKFGSVTPRNLSSFAKELPPEFVSQESLKQMQNTPVTVESAKARFDAVRAMLERIN